MAQAPRTFALDIGRKLLFSNTFSEAGYAFPVFKYGDTERFNITLVKPNPSAGGVFGGALTRISNVGLALKIAIGVFGNTPTVYTSATATLNADGFSFDADVPFNVAAVDALFAAQTADVPCLCEFELNDGGLYQAMDTAVVIRDQLITTTLVSPAAPDTAIGRSEAAGAFMPKIWPAGFQWIATDNDGSGTQYLCEVRGGVIVFSPLS